MSDVALTPENEETLNLLDNPGHISNIISSVIKGSDKAGYSVDGVNIYARKDDDTQLKRIQFYKIAPTKTD